MAADPDVITELDVTNGLYLSDEELDDLRDDWEYWDEIRECCGGRVRDCSHWRQYPPAR